MSQEKLVKSGASLVAVGMFTGLWSAAALTDVVHLQIPRLALAAHLNGLLGGIWLIAVALTFPFLHYNDVQKSRLAWSIAVPGWANWLFTLIASIMGVRGLNFNHDPKNNLVAVLLQVGVVLPSLWGSVYWVRGFCRKSGSPTPI